MPTNLISSLIVVALSVASHADSFSSEGELTLEGRGFLPDVSSVDNFNVSLAGRLKATYKNKPWRANFSLFGRADARDDERSAMFVEEAWVQYKKKKLRIVAGYDTRNWSALEVFHPVDVINARFLDGDIQYPEKIGELMVSARLKFGEGSIEAMAMPVFTEPIFPSQRSRFRFAPPGVGLPEAWHTDMDGKRTDSNFLPQWAVRLQYRFSDLELSAHVLHQLDRQSPFLTPDVVNGVATARLLYAPVMQFGGTAQLVKGGFIFKAEGAYRKLTEPQSLTILPAVDYGLVAGGAEYGISHESGASSTLLFEMQWLLDAKVEEVPFLAFSRHALLGWRADFSDEAGTTLLFSVISNVTDPQQLLLGGELGRRLGNDWKLTAGFRLIHLPADDPDNRVGADWLSGANQAYAKMTRYF